jgi:hypothetical protein
MTKPNSRSPCSFFFFREKKKAMHPRVEPGAGCYIEARPISLQRSRVVKELFVDLTVRLPDISSYAAMGPEYSRYGRFAVTESGHFWAAEVVSSYPSNMKDGFFWAISGGKLLISPRGSTYGYPNSVTPKLLGDLLDYLRMRPEVIVMKKRDDETLRLDCVRKAARSGKAALA